MGLAALVGARLGQTYLTDWHSPLVLITSVASAATLFAIVETPVVSHFLGCTPLGPMARSIVGGCWAAATVGAALAPRLLFPRAGAARGLRTPLTNGTSRVFLTQIFPSVNRTLTRCVPPASRPRSG
ncbi:hypothetical protein Z951_28810 [Streptomyces sp. PRh5]|nr:hypothetical protein Z951_28810 [Streptomyces sp. PRh5]